jgi:hypothetical protein
MFLRLLLFVLAAGFYCGSMQPITIMWQWCKPKMMISGHLLRKLAGVFAAPPKLLSARYSLYWTLRASFSSFELAKKSRKRTLWRGGSYPLHLVSWYSGPCHLKICLLKRQKCGFWKDRNGDNWKNITNSPKNSVRKKVLVEHWAMSPTNLSLNRQNLTAVVGKLTAEVRYLSSKNRLSCRFNNHFFRTSKHVLLSFEAKIAPVQCSVQKFFEKFLKLSGQFVIECPLKT